MFPIRAQWTRATAYTTLHAHLDPFTLFDIAFNFSQKVIAVFFRHGAI
jgi:hypothetical protein